MAAEWEPVLGAMVGWPLIVPFALGLHWKRASVKGAWAAVFAGGAVWLLCKSLGTRIEPWMFGLAASLAAMIVGSLLTPDESQAQFEAGQRAPSVPAYDSA